MAREIQSSGQVAPGKSKKVLQSKVFADSRVSVFESDVNRFLLSHEVSKVTYSTATTEGGDCLFTAFVLYSQEVA